METVTEKKEFGWLSCGLFKPFHTEYNWSRKSSVGITGDGAPILISSNKFHSLFCLRLQVEPAQFGQIDKAGPYLRTLIQTKVRRLNPVSEILYVLNENSKMDNVKKHNNCINMSSSQTFRSYK
jgi:hypothetical protein